MALVEMHPALHHDHRLPAELAEEEAPGVALHLRDREPDLREVRRAFDHHAVRERTEARAENDAYQICHVWNLNEAADGGKAPLKILRDRLMRARGMVPCCRPPRVRSPCL